MHYFKNLLRKAILSGPSGRVSDMKSSKSSLEAIPGKGGLDPDTSEQKGKKNLTNFPSEKMETGKEILRHHSEMPLTPST